MNIKKYIREKQNELIVMVNSMFDEIIGEVEKLEIQENENGYEKEYESVYPITNTTGFKGKKPIAVLYENKRIIAPTWKSVVKTVLQEVIKDKEMKDKLNALSDKLLGRVRKRLSKSSEDMKSPIEICENLYIETHYDTEMLMNLLLQILNEIKYDYNKIKIIIKN